VYCPSRITVEETGVNARVAISVARNVFGVSSAGQGGDVPPAILVRRGPARRNRLHGKTVRQSDMWRTWFTCAAAM